jgi:dihydropteroate synthase
MKTKMMGVINVTPDSFYSGSRTATTKQAVEKALQMASDGADIIDIGGESTRPGSRGITAEEERKQVVPVISALEGRTNARISIDTYKPEVAQAAVDVGATIINDIYGGASPELLKLAADNDLEYIIMQMQGTPATMQQNPTYNNVVNEILAFFRERIAKAEEAGIKPAKIIIDPGIGFGKTTQHNIDILTNIDAFKAVKKRVMIGASRKSFIGRIIRTEENPLPAEERLAGSIAVATYCALKGVDILRVHDVKETVQAAKIMGRFL